MSNSPPTRGPIQIGLDGFTLTDRPYPNSVKYYFEQIIGHLRAEACPAHFTCFTKESQHPLIHPAHRLEMDWRQPPGRMFWWRHVTLPRAIRVAGIEVMWFPFNTVPLWIGTPAVVTVHDISFMALPQFFPWKTRIYLELMLRRSVSQASQIIAISQFTADELMRVFAVPAKRLTVIYHGASPAIGRDDENTATQPDARLGIDSPYFLFLDGPNLRKNLALLMRLLRSAPSRWLNRFQFVITGQREMTARLLTDAGLGAWIDRRLVLPGFLPEAELAALYRAAEALLYISSYEGFGLPMLEAFAYHCPVIALRASCLPEIAGEAALYVQPDDVGALGGALEAVGEASTRADLIAAGTKRLADFCWQRAADDVGRTLLAAARTGPL